MKLDLNQAAYRRGDKKFHAGRYAEAAREFFVALEDWPEDWMAMHALGNCYSEAKKPRKAEKWFRLAIENAPEEERPNLLYNLGNALFDQQRFDEAIRVYREVPRGHNVWRLAANNIAVSEKRLNNVSSTDLAFWRFRIQWQMRR
jgi:tetratricopeptide (TPR) repeat protein